MKRPLKITLWFLLAAAVGLGALIGIGALIGANRAPFAEQPPFTTTNGATIWQAKCALCHGMEGRGGRGPSLVSGAPAGYTLAELRAKIGRGKPLAGMPSFRRELTAAQIEAVARHVIALREAA